MGNAEIFVSLVFPALIMGGIGYAMGSIIDKRKTGFWLGVLLGPIGIIILFLLLLISWRKSTKFPVGNSKESQPSHGLRQGQERKLSADLWTFLQIYLLLIVVNGVIWSGALLPLGGSMFFVNIAYGALFFPLSALVFSIIVGKVYKSRNRSYLKPPEILAILTLNIVCVMTIAVECVSKNYAYNLFELLLGISDRLACDKSLFDTYSDEVTYFPQFAFFVLTTIIFINLINRAYRSHVNAPLK